MSHNWISEVQTVRSSFQRVARKVDSLALLLVLVLEDQFPMFVWNISYGVKGLEIRFPTTVEWDLESFNRRRADSDNLRSTILQKSPCWLAFSGRRVNQLWKSLYERLCQCCKLTKLQPCHTRIPMALQMVSMGMGIIDKSYGSTRTLLQRKCMLFCNMSMPNTT